MAHAGTTCGRRRPLASPGVALLVVWLVVSAPGCGKGDPPLVADPPPPGFRLDEHRREELVPSNHITYRANRADRPVVVRVEEAPEGVANRLSKGFCAAIDKAWGTECSGPDDTGRRLWASEVFIKLHDVAGSVIVDVIGEALLNEGWETADLRLRFGVEGEPPLHEDEDAETAIGRAIGQAWTQKLDAYLAKLAAAVRPAGLVDGGESIRWVAAPGFLREDLWPLSYGIPALVADRAWTFQRSKDSGLRVGYLIDDGGRVVSSEAFDTVPSEDAHGAWTTAPNSERRALLMALPMTAKDKEAVGESDAKVPRFAVVALTRSGDARMVGRARGIPLSAPAIASNGDAMVVATRGNGTVVCRFDSVKSTATCPPLPLPTSMTSSKGHPRFALLPWAKGVFALVTPDRAVAARLSWPYAHPTQAATSTQAPATAPGIPTLPSRPPEPVPAPAPTLVPLPQQAADAGPPPKRAAKPSDGQLTTSLIVGERLWLLGIDSVAIYALDGTLVRVVPAEHAPDRIFAASDRAVATLGSKTAVVHAPSGDVLARIPMKLTAWAFLPGSAGKTDAPGALAAIACGPNGLLALDARYQVRHALPLRDTCDRVHVLADGDIMAARFLWVLRAAPPSAWPAIATDAATPDAP